MTVVPKTTILSFPDPDSITIAMSQTSVSSSTAAAAKPTPVPPHHHEINIQKEKKGHKHEDEEQDGGDFPQPKLRLEIRDLNHPGAAKFLASVNAGTVTSAAVSNVQRLLYRSLADPGTNMPPTRSVTLVLRDMDGVAYTTGTELDDDHKEIHFSLRYINNIHPPSRLTDEITGVLTHELVHCYQWNAQRTCPGGLIEGIADWVRLRCDLSPPHWKRETEGAWDKGYQHTAYFLDFLEHRFGKGTVRRINEKLRCERYTAEEFWTSLLGHSVEKLYQDYVEKSE
ncbi:putative pbsp domain containing protein [Naviculisporaceae sp. PSN 640]